MRDAAIAVIRAVGVETGGANIQFARSRESGELRVIELNPRVSRSSALASKATGYPIAKVAAKLAIGYTLDEIPNDLTQTTPASFEPTLDYVVVKFPRFAFEKFPGADTTLGTQMKAVGEAMGIGRTFTEAFLKAMRSRELDTVRGCAVARPGRRARPACTRGSSPSSTASAQALDGVRSLDDVDWLRLKRLGLSDADIAARVRRGGGRGARRPADRARLPARRLVRRRGRGRARTTSTRPGARPATPSRRGTSRAVVILGSGPNRIGQGIEFDYCCVHAAQSYRSLGYEAVMVNCNPETVSTDYDTSDRLYFEPLGAEEVLAVCEREQPDGIAIQFGGQTPLKLAPGARRGRLPDPRHAARRRRPGRGPRALRRALRASSASAARTGASPATRTRRPRSPSGSATRCSCARPTCSAAARCASATRPSDVREAMQGIQGPTLVDRFLENAIEIDVDALCDGDETYVAAVMEHVEEAGVHSGDSSCVLPPPSLDAGDARADRGRRRTGSRPRSA